MAQFSKTNQPANRGRKKGSKNKRSIISEEMCKAAFEALELALSEREQWAVVEVLKRIAPPLKAITPNESLDGQMLALKIKELHEFEQRLEQLEALAQSR